MIDVQKETTIPLKQVVKYLPGRKRTTKQLIYWCNVGIYSTVTKKRVKLEYVKIGNRYYTSVEAARRFLAQHNRM